ncbi:MAG: T9SS type B sorting domain-containing protein [Crocinitomix sp.]|nr:T9SS type B sorting domain-containing protein [Crocinitomix sp.]
MYTNQLIVKKKETNPRQKESFFDRTRAGLSFISLLILVSFPTKAFLAPTDSQLNLDTLLKQKAVLFEENKNQFYDTQNNPVPFVLFKAETRNVDLYVTETGLTYVFREHANVENTKDLNWERIDLALVDAKIKRENIVKELPASSGPSNFFYGHCPDGIFDVHQYGKITIKEVYPNIDWVLYNTKENGFKYDFIARNGAELNEIRLRYTSKEKLSLSKSGALIIPTNSSTLQENAPVSFLNDSLVPSQFEVLATQPNEQGGFDTEIRLGFDSNIQTILSKQNRNDVLRIDPQLLWSTFFGSEHNDGSHTLETDSQNNLFIGGYTYSMGFPALDAGSYFQGSLTGSVSCIITKFDADGNHIWATYYGGENIDRIFSLAIDSEDNIFACGKTGSNDFPVMDAGTYFQPDDGFDANYDAFILKFDNDGNRLWATYYAGHEDDQFFSIATDSEDNVYAVGTSESYDFPLMDGGGYYQDGFWERDAVILKFDNDGNRLWATYYGGNNTDNAFSIAVDHSDNIFVVGGTESGDFPTQDAGTYYQDILLGGEFSAFLLKFDSDGNRLWATLYGDGQDDLAYCSKIDRHNKLYVSGTTNSVGFPTYDAGTYYDGAKATGLDAFFLKFDNDGNREWATFYGGGGNEQLNTHDNIAMDACGYVYFAFDTPSLDIETQAFCDDAYFRDYLIGSLRDQFLCKFDSTGILLGATYFGGSGTDFRSPLAADKLGNVYLSGEWTPLGGTASYPLVEPETGFYNGAHGGSEDIFIAKFSSAIVVAEFSIVPDLCYYACAGTATVTLIDNGTCPVNYFWSTGDFTLDSTDPTNTITDLCPGWYSLIVTNECDTLLVDSVEVVSIEPVPYDLDLGNDTVFCQTFSHILDGGDEGAAFSWQDGSSDQFFEVTFPGTYWVTVTGDDGCTTTDSITITVAPDIPIDAVSINPTCNGYSDGSITAVALGGEGEITYTITNVGGDVLNEGDSDTADSLETGWYYLYVEDEMGCIGVDSIFLSEPGPLDADLVIIPPTCYGLEDGSAYVNEVLNATGDIDSVSFLWDPNPADVGGVGADSTWFLLHGSYTLVLMDENGCSGVINFEVIQPDSMVFSEFGSEPAYCRLHEYQNGNGFVFAAAAGGTPNYTYLWTNLETEVTSNNTTWGGLNPGNYHVIATDINGCFVESQIYLDSLNPIAKFTLNSPELNEVCEGTADVHALFTNQSENFANPNNPFADTTFFWNFDYDNIDWVISHDLNESFNTTYDARGYSYEIDICLVAINKNGCTDTACKVVTIYEPITFDDVNIFSPNGDGINDEFTFEFKSASIAEFNCVIINRWGIVLHEITSINDGWDGTDKNGNLCTNGVYFYKYVAVADNLTEIIGQGTIQLVE